MSFEVENTPDEIDNLVGGTIEAARIVPDGFGSNKIELVIRFRDGFGLEDQHGRTYRKATFEVWQDVEGNGPGYLAFVGEGDF